MRQFGKSNDIEIRTKLKLSLAATNSSKSKRSSTATTLLPCTIIRNKNSGRLRRIFEEYNNGGCIGGGGHKTLWAYIQHLRFQLINQFQFEND